MMKLETFTYHPCFQARLSDKNKVAKYQGLVKLQGAQHLVQIMRSVLTLLHQREGHFHIFCSYHMSQVTT